MDFIYSNKSAQHNDALSIGGKAANLALLESLGFKVPPWIVIPEKSLLSLVPQGKDISVDVIQKLKITEEKLNKIISFFGDTDYFAVRSSAADEDGTGHSYAGQYSSFLFVSRAQLEDKIKDVWLSAFSDHLKTYRENNGLSDNTAISVIIQKMIPSEVSGVAFGMNPLTGNRSEKVINSVFGLGEGLVSGDLVADNYIVTKDEISKNITAKLHKYSIHSSNGNGTQKVEVDAKNAKNESLTEKQIDEISRMLDTLFEKTGKYQDIEFAYANKQLFLLQTRPITSVNQLPDIGSKYIVWDNSNIIESYPGVTLPLTFSYIIKLYDKAYRQFVALLGVGQDEISQNADYFSNMLGLLNGRVYYNLRSWYKMISILPGYSLNAGFMEKMMGVKESFELDGLEKRGKLSSYIHLFTMVLKILQNLFTLEKQKRKFMHFFDSFMASYDDIKPDELSTNELMDIYSHVESIVLNKWKAPLVNDFFAMIYFGLLSKTVEKYFGKESNVHNDLLCGARDIVSTKPVYLIKLMVNIITSSALLKQVFEEKTEHEIWTLIKDGKMSDIEPLIMEYINDFGDRYVGELKLETQTYTQNPHEFVAVLKSYIIADAKFTMDTNVELELRKDAEEKIAKAFKGKFLKKWITKHIIKKTRELVSGRENLRLYRTKAFGKTRIIFRGIGKKFYAENLIEDKEDIFYLTKEEIFDYIKGTSVNYDLKGLVTYRKKQFIKLKHDAVQAERIKSYGIVYNSNNFNVHQESKIENEDLKGIACCKGVVKAQIRIVHDPKEISNLNGDILVTSSTDPGWVILFPSVSGILVERGSLLSHSAIVSREMGIPCIVGISNLLRTLKTGDWVEMDGSSGKIKILNQL